RTSSFPDQKPGHALSRARKARPLRRSSSLSPVHFLLLPCSEPDSRYRQSIAAPPPGFSVQGQHLCQTAPARLVCSRNPQSNRPDELLRAVFDEAANCGPPPKSVTIDRAPEHRDD